MFRGAIEPWHLILLIVVLVLLFGSKKLPEMSRSLMRSMHIMKDEARKLRDDKGDDPRDGPQAQLTRAAADTEARDRARAHASSREPTPPADPR